jgi:hypothetical protein
MHAGLWWESQKGDNCEDLEVGGRIILKNES